jgi:orotidine-5'-phosphate decarboxylase
MASLCRLKCPLVSISEGQSIVIMGIAFRGLQVQEARRILQHNIATVTRGIRDQRHDECRRSMA